MSSTLRWEHRTNLPSVHIGNIPVVGPKDAGALSDLPYHNEPVVKDKYGRIHLRYVTPNPPLPPNVVLPGRRKLDEEAEEGYDGYILEKPRVEIALGKVTHPIFSGTEWTEPIMKFIDQHYGDQFISSANAVIATMGGMGAGKSTLAFTILGLLARHELYKEVHIVGPTVDIDSTLFDLNFERDPKVSFTFSRQIDVPWLEKKREDMSIFLQPYKRKAFQGKYKTPEKSKAAALFHRMNKNFDDPNHPFQNSDGTLHGRAPILPQYQRKRIHTDDMPDILHPHQSTQTAGSRFRLASKFDAINSHYASEEYQNMYQKYNRVPLQTFQAPRRIDIVPTAQYINDMMTQLPSAKEHAAQAFLAEKALQDPLSFKKHQEPEPSILFIEDGSYFLKGATESYVREWVTRIRHNRQLLIINFHKVTAMITPIRAVLTDLYLSRITNSKEVEVLNKEFGGKIPDFRGKLNAATAPLPGREKDFFHANLLNGEVYRGFSGKLVPARRSRNASS